MAKIQRNWKIDPNNATITLNVIIVFYDRKISFNRFVCGLVCIRPFSERAIIYLKSFSIFVFY